MLGNWEQVFKFAAKLCCNGVEEREDNVDDAIVVLKTHHPKCVMFCSLISSALLRVKIIKNIIKNIKIVVIQVEQFGSTDEKNCLMHFDGLKDNNLAKDLYEMKILGFNMTFLTLKIQNIWFLFVSQNIFIS